MPALRAASVPMIDLGSWLLEQGTTRRKFSAFDCCTLPADWAVANGWPDPMADYRGTYQSHDKAVLLVEQAGGLLALFADAFVRIGMPAHDHAATGDIGVIMFGDLATGAICTGDRWAFVGNRGLGFCAIPRDNIKATWSVTCG